MYMSKIILNPSSYQVQKEIGNPYQLHKTVMNAFPEDLKKMDRDGRVLYRLSKNKQKSNPYLLIQSTVVPNWEHLLGNEDYLQEVPMFKQFQYPNFKKGDKFRFRLFGNPTKKVEGSRVGLYKDEEQYEWIQRKAKLGGFKLVHVAITHKEEITAKKHKKAPIMTFFGVLFEGILQVKNPQKFKKTLKNGIGSGKAFGFGFLTISNI